jgi:hypothetical protein
MVCECKAKGMKAGSCKKSNKIKLKQVQATQLKANAQSNRATAMRKKVYK